MSEVQSTPQVTAGIIQAFATTIQTPPSAIRRKPKYTYQSPSAHIVASLRIEGPLRVSTKPPSPILALPPKLPPAPTPAPAKSAHVAPKGRLFPMAPPLPLYHPLGRLALSLPDLDPTALGLPAPPSASRRTSVRARRPTTKLRDAIADGGIATPPMSASTPPPAAEASAKDKEKPPSSRRRRAGGTKRKRADADEDATYPARRSRNPRRAANEEPASRGGSLSEEGAEAEKEKRPERRSTRSSGNAQRRRNSSGSEATATSASVILAKMSERVDEKMEEPAAPPEQDATHMDTQEVEVDSAATPSINPSQHTMETDSEPKEEHNTPAEEKD